jgi:hypothetical protein
MDDRFSELLANKRNFNLNTIWVQEVQVKRHNHF